MKLLRRIKTFLLCPLGVLLLFSACGTAGGIAAPVGASRGAESRPVANSGSSFAKTALSRRFPGYRYDGKDPVEKLAYETETGRSRVDRDGCFVVVSPKVIDTSEEQGLLKVFVISYGKGYKIYNDDTVYTDSGWNIPVAVTYRKQPGGSYVMEKYEMPEDGGGYADSIRAFCKTPATGTEIAGLPEKMTRPYDLGKNLNANLQKYLKKNKLDNVKMMDG